MMKNKRIYFFTGLLLVFIFYSCNKKASPSVEIVNSSVADPAAFNYVYSEGVKQKLMGNSAEAISKFEQSILINPLSDAAYYEIAEIALSGGDLKTGKKYARKAYELDDNNVWYLIMLANIYQEERNLDSASFLYEKAILNYPERDDIRLELGNVLSEKGEYQKAVDVFDFLDKKFGFNDRSTLLKVQNLMLLKEYDKAEETVTLLLNQYPDVVLYKGLLAEIFSIKGESDTAMLIYNDLLEQNPGNAQVQLSLIEFLQKEGNYDDLVNFLNTILLNDNVIKEDKASLMMNLFEDSILLESYSKNLEISLMLLESQYAGDEIITLLRPELYLKESRYAEAISQLENYIKSFPNSYYAWEKMMIAYSDTGDNEKLYIKGKEFATKFNTSILAKLLYAVGATEAKDYKTAEEELRKATILANEDKQIMLQILSMEADLAYRIGEYEKAFSKFDELLQISPDNIGVLNNYAYFLAEQNLNLKEAEKMSEKTILAEGENVIYLDTYAWVLFKRGKYKEAAKIMEDIMSSSEPEDSEYYEHYGYILKELNSCEKAIGNWEKAIELDNTKVNLKEEISNCSIKR